MESSESGMQLQLQAGKDFIENGDSASPASAAADHFSVDQFLNLNAESIEDDENLLTGFPHQQSNHLYSEFSDFASSPPPLQQPSAAAGGNLGFLLTLPEEEPGLEWISYFLEDSFSQFYHATGASLTANPMPERASPPPCSSPPRSQRSKRHRSALPASGKVWRLASPPSSSLTESTTTSSPSSSATSLPYWPASPSTPLAFKDRNKKSRRRRKKGRVGPGPVTGTRRCSHCGIQKTPQWRAGPMGAKTLCNACGVRFKSGRLLPEYRPACSPTFSTQLHSNSHRKVMEMRRKKELDLWVKTEPAVFPKFG